MEATYTELTLDTRWDGQPFVDNGGTPTTRPTMSPMLPKAPRPASMRPSWP